MLLQGYGIYSRGETSYYWYSALDGGNLWWPHGSAGCVRIRRDGTMRRFALNVMNDSELAGICFSPDGQRLLTGAMEIRDVNAALGLSLDDSEYTTLGGLLFGQLGRLPKPGDKVSAGGVAFEIVEMEGRRVGKVRLLEKVG